MTTVALPKGALPWDQLRSRLDESQPFNLMRNTPYYRDAVYEQFSKEEYARRYAALRTKMREQKLDVVIVPGGPSHWSFGGGMLWLTGHWEWHALSSYVLVPRDGEHLVFCAGLADRDRKIPVRPDHLFKIGSCTKPFVAATLLSLVESCRRCGVEPFAYIRDLLARVSTHPASRIAELLPDVWKPAPS